MKKSRKGPGNNRGITIYLLISFLFLILGIELYCYVNMNQWKVEKMITGISGENDKLWIFSYGALIIVFLLGIISGIIAFRKAGNKTVAIAVTILNVICLIVNSGHCIYDTTARIKTEVAKVDKGDTSVQDVIKENDLPKDEEKTIETETEESSLTEDSKTDDQLEQHVDNTVFPEENMDYSEFEGKYSYFFTKDDNVYEGNTWKVAYANCTAIEGKMITFESKKEFEYVAKDLSDQGLEDYIFFIGGRREKNSQWYYWVDENNELTGDPLNGLDSWMTECWEFGEPSFDRYENGVEDTVMCMYYNKDEEKWKWKDMPNNLTSIYPEYEGKVGFVKEEGHVQKLKYEDTFFWSDHVKTWTEAYDSGVLATFKSKEELNYVTSILLEEGMKNYIFFVGGRRNYESNEYYWIDEQNQLIGDVLNTSNSWLVDYWNPAEPSFKDENGVEETVLALVYNENLEEWRLTDVSDDFLKQHPEYRGGFIVRSD